MKNIESKLILYIQSLNNYTLFKGSGFSLFGQIFKEYLLISINHKNVNLNNSLCEKIENHLSYLEKCNSFYSLTRSKEYLQLLCFYLSYRNYFNPYKYSNTFTDRFLNIDTSSYLKEMGCHRGKPGSGNFSMFYVIIIYNLTKDNNDIRILEWFSFFDKYMNNDGFWGNKHITYQLQNGYHQYEIYNFFNRPSPKKINIKKILDSQDHQGHFGPYIGGGGCYDFDTVDLIYNIDDNNFNKEIDNSLELLYKSLLKEQNIDGGFSESPYISNFINSILSIFCYTLRNLNLPRLKFLTKTIISFGTNLKLITHWSPKHRNYNISDTWNSWFRLLTIYKIRSRLYKENDKSKIFPFPGIAFKHIKFNK